MFFSSFTFSVTLYPLFLCFMLFLWVLYLILPRGLRQYMFKSYPKRFALSNNPRIIQQTSMAKVIGLTANERMYPIDHTDSRSKDYETEDCDVSNMDSSVSSHYKHIRKEGRERVLLTVMEGDAIENHSSYGQLLTGNHLLEKRCESGVMSSRFGFTRSGSSDVSSSDVSSSMMSSSIMSGVSFDTSENGPISNNHNCYAMHENTTSTPDVALSTPKPALPRRDIIDSRGSAEELPTISRQESLQSFFGSLTSTETSPSRSLSKQQQDRNSLLSTKTTPSKPSMSRQELHQIKVHNINTSSRASPSPHHPDLSNTHHAPSQELFDLTMKCLNKIGIRLYAHGAHCRPRQIWILLNTARDKLLWRTQNLPDVCNVTSNPMSTTDAIASFMGPLHEIDLSDILYVDVGKTTAALRLLEDSVVEDNLCFSLLTKDGSLDLQTENWLERDALVSCFCWILDTLYLQSKRISGNDSSGERGGGWRDLVQDIRSSANESVGEVGKPSSDFSSISSSDYIPCNNIDTRSKDDRQNITAARMTISENDVFRGIEHMSSSSGSSAFRNIEQLNTAYVQGTIGSQDTTNNPSTGFSGTEHTSSSISSGSGAFRNMEQSSTAYVQDTGGSQDTTNNPSTRFSGTEHMSSSTSSGSSAFRDMEQSITAYVQDTGGTHSTTEQTYSSNESSAFSNGVLVM